MHYLLIYHYTADYLQRRSEYRSAHLAAAWAAQQRGELVLAGTAGVAIDTPDRAVFVFDVDSPAPIEAFVQADPYVAHGLVVRHDILAWNTAVGADAKTPVRP